jgi:pyruvate dehydrogenase E2 component (dihydrolipoamide acetyltransferase)
MPSECKLPELGEGVDSGTVTRVLVSVGDSVEIDQPLIEMETGKATFEVPSTVAGTVSKIHAEEGGTLKVGDTILILSEDGPPAAPAEEAVEETEDSVAPVSASEQEPEEADPESETPAAVEEPASTASKEDAVEKPPAAALSSGGQVAAAPSVRRLAREVGVDIDTVSGAGPGGRITADDVKAHARQAKTEPRRPAGAPSGPSRSLPDFTRWGEVERQAMSNIRRSTAEHLAHAWASIPHVTQFDKADVTELEKLRKKYAKRAEDAGGKLTVTAILVKTVAAALKKFPQFNASVDLENHEIILKNYYNIGVAVDTEHGLLVPVVRDADEKNIVELSVEITKLAERARARKLSPDDMSGGTFTVSNLGGIGGTGFTPVVNWPELAILGTARSVTEPVYIEDTFRPRRMLPLTLSYDHRVVDGADGARFLRWVAESLEQPFLVFLEG